MIYFGVTKHHLWFEWINSFVVVVVNDDGDDHEDNCQVTQRWTRIRI